MIIDDPPFGFNKHENSCLNLKEEINQWDKVAWSGQDVAQCITASIDAGFIKPDCIVVVHSELRAVDDIIAATAKLNNASNHQVLYCYKPGHNR